MTPKQLVAIRKHGEQLNAIFHTGIEPVALCKKLRRIEGEAHRLAEDACNYLSMESEEFIRRDANIMHRAETLLMGNKLPRPVPIMFNLDPRGYALKINDEYMRAHSLNLTRDLGGYGILAPEIGKDGE